MEGLMQYGGDSSDSDTSDNVAEQKQTATETPSSESSTSDHNKESSKDGSQSSHAHDAEVTEKASGSSAASGLLGYRPFTSPSKSKPEEGQDKEVSEEKEDAAPPEAESKEEKNVTTSADVTSSENEQSQDAVQGCLSSDSSSKQNSSDSSKVSEPSVGDTAKNVGGSLAKGEELEEKAATSSAVTPADNQMESETETTGKNEEEEGDAQSKEDSKQKRTIVERIVVTADDNLVKETDSSKQKDSFEITVELNEESSVSSESNTATTGKADSVNHSSETAKDNNGKSNSEPVLSSTESSSVQEEAAPGYSDDMPLSKVAKVPMVRILGLKGDDVDESSNLTEDKDSDSQVLGDYEESNEPLGLDEQSMDTMEAPSVVHPMDAEDARDGMEDGKEEEKGGEDEDSEDEDKGEEDTNLSTQSGSKKRRQSFSGYLEVKATHEFVKKYQHVTAEKVFEYQWPPGHAHGGEFYMLQEQVSEYLGVISFKRKYPDLARRPIEMDERLYLKDQGVVTETQCDLGLTPLKSEDVLDLMQKDFPEKYQEYMKVLQERERKTIRDRNKGYEQEKMSKIDKTKLEQLMKKAVRSAAEFNQQFMREYRDERKAYFDLQTQEVHYPKGRFKVLPPEATKVGSYPVAVIPGQFQDYYKRYSAHQLKYLPVNTTLVDPPRPSGVAPEDPSSDGNTDDTSSSQEDSQETGETGSGDDASSTDSDSIPLAALNAKEAGRNTPRGTPGRNTPKSAKKNGKLKKGTPKREEKCSVCKNETNEKMENLVKCAECGSKGHPTCLELTEEMIGMIKTYPWQCMECKTCVKCMDAEDEDKMMFCDHCDRGYHTFCVGLKGIPTGRWDCPQCRPREPSRKRARNR